jgi:hypothetical protein
MTHHDTDGVFHALAHVENELYRQDEKWGEQNHPDGTGRDCCPNEWTIGGSDTALELAEYAKEDNAAAVGRGDLTWRGILLEEVWEALAEPEGSDELRTELIQVAAVAVQWVRAIDRRRAAA